MRSACQRSGPLLLSASAQHPRTRATLLARRSDRIFSTFLPRRLDAVLAVLVFPAGAILYKAHTQFANTTLARAVETLWQNAGPLVFSDALSRTAAWVDLAC